MRRIFISSVWSSRQIPTFSDLRIQCYWTARSLGWEPWLDVINAPDLDITVDAIKVKAACLDEVQNCDLYVGLFADRYGSARFDYEGELSRTLGIALTELELHQALFSRKAVLLYILSVAGSVRDIELEGLLASLRDDGLISRANIRYVTKAALVTTFKRDLSRSTWKKTFAITIPRSGWTGIRSSSQLSRVANLVLRGGASTRTRSRFHPDRIAHDLTSIETAYREAKYSFAYANAVETLSALASMSPVRPEHLDLWLRCAWMWNKSANWLGITGIGPLTDLAGARLLKHLVHRDGTLKRLFEFHWIDGAIASCLRNIAKRTMNSSSRVARLHDAETRVLSAIAHAQTSEQRAGCYEIHADIFEIKGDVKQAKAMYRSALALRAKAASPADSFGNVIARFAHLSGDEKLLREGLQICEGAGHPGFCVQLKIRLARLLLSRNHVERAVQQLAEASALEHRYLGRRREAKALLMPFNGKAEQLPVVHLTPKGFTFDL